MNESSLTSVINVVYFGFCGCWSVLCPLQQTLDFSRK